MSKIQSLIKQFEQKAVPVERIASCNLHNQGQVAVVVCLFSRTNIKPKPLSTDDIKKEIPQQPFPEYSMEKLSSKIPAEKPKTKQANFCLIPLFPKEENFDGIWERIGGNELLTGKFMAEKYGDFGIRLSFVISTSIKKENWRTIYRQFYLDGNRYLINVQNTSFECAKKLVAILAEQLKII